MSEAKRLHSASEALDDLYRRHSSWLKCRLRTMAPPEDAADAVHDAYLRLAPYVTAGIRYPRALLLRVATNLLRDQARRDGQGRLVAGSAGPHRIQPAEQADRVLLLQILRDMPANYRDVFVLNRFEGMTYLEIAHTLGVSVKNVEWRMSRALSYCSSRLEP